MLGVLLGVVVGLLTINPVHTLGLGELVNLAADNAGQELLGESVAHGLACNGSVQKRSAGGEERTVLALMVLVGLHGTEGSGTGGELVGELALVVLLTVVHLLVSLLRFVWWWSAWTCIGPIDRGLQVMQAGIRLHAMREI